MAEWLRASTLHIFNLENHYKLSVFLRCAVSAKITCRQNFEIRTKTKNIYFESFILHSIFTRLGMTAKVWLLQRILFITNSLYYEHYLYNEQNRKIIYSRQKISFIEII